ncbi:MAG: CoA-binding protein [Candidatus Parvarchaeota archaeon]|jgi:predicted CoA-binding protein|nr:CoA-binding protein [Candidatus Parvarchaeota archaeon]MCL5018098.1 CoA-binding protein [Candidatus Parvarchaeota archaeon]
MENNNPECSIEEHEKIMEMPKDKHTDQEVREILSKYKKVAVVGMSRESGKDSHEIPLYLINKGYDVIPVNPNADSILDKKSYPSISEVPEAVEIVDIFRPSDKVLPVVQAAISKNPKVIWMQEGISNDEAKKLAESKGITVIFNRCMMKEHIRLLGS